ncbi:hypothetical protein A3D03_01875 [Candidatus Gottesmanbacteria bacterium RIFCSPHIGHO2_02_FULL_40_13]|uniref:Methyltransferase type 11 domain-containing protein n=1 Tax=Candidatus Gottesmanbacteria bacterium RIFCSPHIGHO2_02_FULL_40_13 TaxID=1798384 RepID=A0A1F6ABD8_9BACT|nr:MAG: hypothetical protein A3D03_01875 [Candidatus Gottesmanbacteria bacterium RIFCSPHIGHO2_02_FULL_40_13]
MRLSKIKLFDYFYKAYHAWPLIYSNLIQLLSFGQWEQWQQRVFDDISGHKILEIGVGPGKLLLKLVQKGYDITGIELRRGMAFEARRRLKRAGYLSQILQQNIEKLPFDNEIFDCIVLTFVLAEITHLEKAILEMKRVLKTNGKVIIIAGGIPQDNNLIARILFRLVSPHTTLHLQRNNMQYFHSAGFEVKRTDFGPFNIVNKIVAVK